MKKTLLFTFLCLSALGYAQMFDNTPGYYINELIASISGTDSPDEFIELRGPANGTLPAGTYFITIEGDGESGNLGEVQEALDLSGLSFGANGYLTITFGGSSYEGNFVANSNNYTEVDVTAYDGDLIDYSASYLLISAPSNPDGVNVDSGGDGGFDTVGDHTNWIIYDSVSSLDDDGTEYGYAQMNVATNFDSTPGIFNTISGSSVISPNDRPDPFSAVNVYYIARQGASTGYDTVTDWMVGQTNSGSTRPFWDFTGSTDKCIPDALAGYTLEASTFGGLNFDPADDVLSTSEFDTFGFDIYPNPAKTLLNIKVSDQTEITSVEIYNILGSRVLSTSTLINNAIDVSEMTSGIYLLKINAGNNAVTKRVVIE